MGTPHEAAIAAWSHIKNDPQPLMIPREWVEGKHIPEGTFDEFIHELKSMGACIHSYAPRKRAIVSGQ